MLFLLNLQQPTMTFLKLLTVACKVIFPYMDWYLKHQPGLLALFMRQWWTTWPLRIYSSPGMLSVNVLLHSYRFSFFSPTFKSQLNFDPFCTSSFIVLGFFLFPSYCLITYCHSFVSSYSQSLTSYFMCSLPDPLTNTCHLCPQKLQPLILSNRVSTDTAELLSFLTVPSPFPVVSQFSFFFSH